MVLEMRPIVRFSSRELDATKLDGSGVSPHNVPFFDELRNGDSGCGERWCTRPVQGW
jgi:hypothetical protein